MEKGRGLLAIRYAKIVRELVLIHTSIQLTCPAEIFPHNFVQIYGQSPQERTRWHRQFDFGGTRTPHAWVTLGLPRHMLL